MTVSSASRCERFSGSIQRQRSNWRNGSAGVLQRSSRSSTTGRKIDVLQKPFSHLGVFLVDTAFVMANWRVQRQTSRYSSALAWSSAEPPILASFVSSTSLVFYHHLSYLFLIIVFCNVNQSNFLSPGPTSVRRRSDNADRFPQGMRITQDAEGAAKLVGDASASGYGAVLSSRQVPFRQSKPARRRCLHLMVGEIRSSNKALFQKRGELSA